MEEITKEKIDLTAWKCKPSISQNTSLSDDKQQS